MSRHCKRNLIGNAILFQVLWLACVIGAAHQRLLPGALAFMALLIWQLWPAHSARGDTLLMAISGPLGFGVDSLWIQSGLLTYATPLPSPGWAPFWIVLLWLGLALTLNHSLHWLKHRPVLAALLGAIASPLSYFAGERLDAVSFHQHDWLMLLVFAVSWAFLLPMLLLLARRLSAVEASAP